MNFADTTPVTIITLFLATAILLGFVAWWTHCKDRRSRECIAILLAIARSPDGFCTRDDIYRCAQIGYPPPPWSRLKRYARYLHRQGLIDTHASHHHDRHPYYFYIRESGRQSIRHLLE